LDKYEGRYDAGYNVLRSERLERMKQLGIVPADTELSHRLPTIPKWQALSAEQQRREARRMELHAGMVENVDHHLGRLFEYLKHKGLYDSTVIIFFSDNGASPIEFHNYPGTTREWVERNSDNSYENLGRRGSRIGIGAAWASASNTPLRHFKGVHSEGGIRVPFIIAGPGVTRTGQIQSTFTHVMDITPTLLELAGVSHSTNYQGREVHSIWGKSMVSFMEGKTDVVREESDAVGWELFGRRAIRQGRWKATWIESPFGKNDWQLFDVTADVSERHDLAVENKEKLNELILLWEEYADEAGVIMPSTQMKLTD
jgi:arylsulfatase